MITIFLASVPTLVLIAVGFLALRFKLLEKACVTDINTFLVTFCLPALLFRLIIELDFAEIELSYLYASLTHRITCLLLSSLFAPLLSRTIFPSTAPNLIIFTSFSVLCWTNTIIIGLPVAELLLGNNHLITL
ncbi:hypothetical protein GEMRC1_003550 [Eukaryota sp. GEM-RC1]